MYCVCSMAGSLLPADQGSPRFTMPLSLGVQGYVYCPLTWLPPHQFTILNMRDPAARDLIVSLPRWQNYTAQIMNCDGYRE